VAALCDFFCGVNGDLRLALPTLGRVPIIRIIQISSGFFARQGGNPQEYWLYFKDCQRSMTENPPEDGR